jgi:PIN domain nuclease of toxin-antitoxin system
VADTHTALWHLFDDARLSVAAGTFISQAATRRNKIAVLPDRMVAATAVYFDVPVISRDKRIRAASTEDNSVSGPSGC